MKKQVARTCKTLGLTDVASFIEFCIYGAPTLQGTYLKSTGPHALYPRGWLSCTVTPLWRSEGGGMFRRTNSPNFHPGGFRRHFFDLSLLTLPFFSFIHFLFSFVRRSAQATSLCNGGLLLVSRHWLTAAWKSVSLTVMCPHARSALNHDDDVSRFIDFNSQSWDILPTFLWYNLDVSYFHFNQ